MLCAVAGGWSAASPRDDLARGRVLFMNGTQGRKGCVFCHTLAATGANGPYGADLDAIARQDWKLRGLDEAQIRDLVLAQITRDAFCLDPHDPGRCMPKGIVTGQDALDVASFVAHCAGHAGVPRCRREAGGVSAAGRDLYLSLRCAGCHSTTGNAPGSGAADGLAQAVGPSFKGLFGSRVRLAGGGTVTAGAAYLIVSILSPDAQIVDGFRPGVMTAMIRPGAVSVGEARALVAYIKTIR